MKIITNIKNIEGKTIKSAVFIDTSESLALIFSDETYSVIDVDFYGECHSMELSDKIDASLKWEAGIITQEEYDVIKINVEQAYKEAERTRELAQLERLKKKYG